MRPLATLYWKPRDPSVWGCLDTIQSRQTDWQTDDDILQLQRSANKNHYTTMMGKAAQAHIMECHGWLFFCYITFVAVYSCTLSNVVMFQAEGMIELTSFECATRSNFKYVQRLVSAQPSTQPVDDTWAGCLLLVPWQLHSSYRLSQLQMKCYIIK